MLQKQLKKKFVTQNKNISYPQNENTIKIKFTSSTQFIIIFTIKPNIKIEIYKFFKYFTGRNQASSQTVYKITHFNINSK